MTVSAIETEYKGYRFRSRLEARWAVFFDELGIDYEYEPEGFMLADGVRYLPDFYLPRFTLYIEVKPKMDRHCVDSLQVKEWERKCRLFRDVIGKAIMIVYGDPAEDIWGNIFAWIDDGEQLITDDSAARFIRVWGNKKDEDTERYYNERVVVMSYGDPYVGPNREQNELVVGPKNLQKWYPGYVFDKLCEVMIERFDPKGHDDLNKAKLAARQARFEYGEHGARRA